MLPRFTLLLALRVLVPVVLAGLAPATLAQTAPEAPPATTAPAPFGDRFGAPEPRVELSPSQPSVAAEALPFSTAVVALSETSRDLSALPPAVGSMRERLMTAARSGDLVELREVVSWNRIRPRLDGDPVDDPVVLWRSQYPDSEGREVLAILLDLLDAPYARVDGGTPNEMYVWPAFAHVPLRQLGPPEIVELLRIVTSFDVQQMSDANAWTFFRVGIAADGTWHYFLAGE